MALAPLTNLDMALHGDELVRSAIILRKRANELREVADSLDRQANILTMGGESFVNRATAMTKEDR